MIPKLTKIWHGWKVNARHLRPITKASWRAKCRRYADLHSAMQKISTVAGRIMSFAGLRYYQLTTDGERTKFLSDAQEKITVFTLGIFHTGTKPPVEEALTALFDANADLARYRPAIRRIRALEPYQLSDELEKFLHDLGAVWRCLGKILMRQLPVWHLISKAKI